MSTYYSKYIKYKNKYLNLIQYGICPTNPIWNDKTPFVSKITIQPIISGSYSITPVIKNEATDTINIIYSQIQTGETPCLKSLTERINERETRIEQIKSQRKEKNESYGKTCNHNSFDKVLDEALQREQGELTKEKTNYNNKKKEEELFLQSKELEIITRKLLMINYQLSDDTNQQVTNKEQQIINYINYRDSIIIIFDFNQTYLQDEIDKLYRNQLGIFLGNINKEPLLNKKLEMYNNYQLLFSGIFRDDLQKRKEIFIKDIKKINDIIDYYIKIITSSSESSKSSIPQIIFENSYFFKYDNEQALDLNKLLAFNNLKSNFKQVNFTDDILQKIFSTTVINGLNKDTKQLMINNANRLKESMQIM